MAILVRAVAIFLGLSSLALVSCQTSGTKVTFSSPIEVPRGRVVGYIDPDVVYHPNPKPTSLDLYFQPSDSTRSKLVRLTTTHTEYGMSLVSIGDHCYTVPIDKGGRPPPPGPFQGGIGVVTHDAVLDVQGMQPRYLVLRDRGTMLVGSLPPPLHYAFSDRPDLQYSIQPGSQTAPKPTKKL